MPEKNRFPAVLVPDTAHTLRAEGFDASEDGTGRGTPLVPCHTTGAGFWQEGFGTLRAREQDSHENVVCVHGTQDPCTNEHIGFALGRNHGGENVIGFSCKDHGADASPVAPTLRSMGHHGSHANGGGQVAVAFDTTQVTSPSNYSNPKPGDPCHPLSAGAHPPAIATTMQVRRLTVVECCRLQGFPDDHVTIPWKGKPAAECPDGPRYKSLGNSMAVPCMAWIGRRIQNHLSTP